MRWFGAQGELGELRCEYLGFLVGHGPTPFERAVAVVTDLAPIDAVERTGSSLHGRQCALLEEPHELLTECPGAGLPLDVALQTQKAATGNLSRLHFVHHGPLSS
jgi:hypothetical protein